MSCIDTERRLESRRRPAGVRLEARVRHGSKPFLVRPKTKMLFFEELRFFDSRGVRRSDQPFLRSYEENTARASFRTSAGPMTP
eukprot:3722613-Prymnesium_polylepis.1